MIAPTPGLVVDIDYLWAREHRTGATEGRKTRPGRVADVESQASGPPLVDVCPITHSPIGSPYESVLLPPRVKWALRLDEEPSWIIATETNQLFWPGFDIRPTPDGREAYGEIPARILTVVLALLNFHAQRGQRSRIDRRD